MNVILQFLENSNETIVENWLLLKQITQIYYQDKGLEAILEDNMRF